MSNYQSGYEEFVAGQYQTSVKLRQTRGGNESMYVDEARPLDKKCPDCGAMVSVLYGGAKEYGYKQVCKACYVNYPDEWTALLKENANG